MKSIQKHLISFSLLSSLTLIPGASSLFANDGPSNVNRDKVKHEVHKKIDAVDEKAINQKIDEIADMVNPDKLKAAVDQMADTFDPERIKQMVDLVAQCMDRDKIKALIDEMARYYDRDKIKEVATEIVRHIDKESLKSQFDQKVDQVADSLQSAYEFIKDEVQKYGSNMKMIQNHLNQYNWKSFIPEKATSEIATLSDLKLNGHRKVVVARPGEQIKGEVICDYNRDECSALKMYRVVLGIKNRGGQTTVGKHIGFRVGQIGKELENFVLVAPKDPGIYEVGFKAVQAALESSAIQEWNEDGHIHTIGLIVVL